MTGRLTERDREAWADMRRHVRGLESLDLVSFTRTSSGRQWIATAPIGHVAHADEASLGSYLGRRFPAERIRDGDIRTRHGRHPGILVIEQTVIDPLSSPVFGGTETVSASRSIKQGTVIGITESGKPATLKWEGGHTIIVGSTGSGKSTLMRLIAASLAWCDDGDVIVAETGKRGEDYDGLNLTDLISTPNELSVMMERLTRIASGRARLPFGTRRRPIVVIIDEFAVARLHLAGEREQAVKKADEAWQLAFSLWRSAGISMCIGSQRGTTDNIPSAPRSQALQRVCMRVASDVEWNYMAQSSSLRQQYRWSPAEFPEHQGFLALQRMGTSLWERARTFHAPDGAQTVYPQPGREGGPGGGSVDWGDRIGSLVTTPKGTVPLVADPFDPQTFPVRHAILATLRPEPQGKKLIAARVGRGATTVLTALRALADEGLAEQTPEGWRTPIHQGESHD